MLSDIHPDTSHYKTDEVCLFLSSVDCDRLILNGRISSELLHALAS